MIWRRRAARARLPSAASWSTDAFVSLWSLAIFSLRLLLINHWVSLSICLPRFSTSWARFSPVAMALRMEVRSSFLFACSRMAICLRPAADFSALRFTTPVSLAIFFSTARSFLATTRPRLWIFLRKEALARRMLRQASSFMRRVAASRAAFFLAWRARWALNAAHTLAVSLVRRLSACLRSRARVLRICWSLALKLSDILLSLRVVSAAMLAFTLAWAARFLRTTLAAASIRLFTLVTWRRTVVPRLSRPILNSVVALATLALASARAAWMLRTVWA